MIVRFAVPGLGLCRAWVLMAARKRVRPWRTGRGARAATRARDWCAGHWGRGAGPHGIAFRLASRVAVLLEVQAGEIESFIICYFGGLE